MDEIYLVTSPSWEKGKVNIKIGRSIHAEIRKKDYYTHNPEAGFICVIETPSKVFSEFIEHALLFSIHRERVSATEWYKVNESKYEEFKKLSTLKEVLVFCEFEYYLRTQEEISYSKLLDDSPNGIKPKTYAKHIAKYTQIRKELETI